MKTGTWMCMLAVALGLALANRAAADELVGVKGRMIQRKGEVQALLAAKAAGENNHGFVEARGKVSGPQAAVISAENDDRRQVYGAIAAKTGVTPAQVGVQRAASIAEKAPPGTLIQQPDGSWRAK